MIIVGWFTNNKREKKTPTRNILKLFRLAFFYYTHKHSDYFVYIVIGILHAWHSYKIEIALYHERQRNDDAKQIEKNDCAAIKSNLLITQS